jgi:hypothetical protein
MLFYAFQSLFSRFYPRRDCRQDLFSVEGSVKQESSKKKSNIFDEYDDNGYI